jgi:hypothetical protein
MNFLTESTAKQKLETIMRTCNLTQVVTFPMRISNNNSIFLDSMKYSCISVYPLENGLSDYDEQIPVFENTKIPF